jgi:hypothetical protein
VPDVPGAKAQEVLQRNLTGAIYLHLPERQTSINYDHDPGGKSN